MEIIPAFRWKNGKIFALAVNGIADYCAEYLYLHIQKRTMNYAPGLENEDSFMIVPNAFVKDHELTPEETEALMIPDDEYEKAIRKKYSHLWGKPRRHEILKRIKIFMNYDHAMRVIKLKLLLNKFLGRKLTVKRM